MVIATGITSIGLPMCYSFCIIAKSLSTAIYLLAILKFKMAAVFFMNSYPITEKPDPQNNGVAARIIQILVIVFALLPNMILLAANLSAIV